MPSLSFGRPRPCVDRVGIDTSASEAPDGTHDTIVTDDLGDGATVVLQPPANPVLGVETVYELTNHANGVDAISFAGSTVKIVSGGFVLGGGITNVARVRNVDAVTPKFHAYLGQESGAARPGARGPMVIALDAATVDMAGPYSIEYAEIDASVELTPANITADGFHTLELLNDGTVSEPTFAGAVTVYKESGAWDSSDNARNILRFQGMDDGVVTYSISQQTLVT